MQKRHLIMIAALLLPAGVGPVLAAESPDAAPSQEIPAGTAPATAESAGQETAIAILRRMSEFLAGQPRFRLRADRSVDLVLDNGMTVESDSRATVSVRRPDGVRVARPGVEFDQDVYYDGKALTLHRSNGLYASIPAPATLDEALDRAIERLGIVPPSADLLYTDPYKVLTQDMIEAMYLGLALIDGTRCHHLAFRNEFVDWQIWVQEGDRPLPRKMVVTDPGLEGAPKFVVYLSDWDLAPRFTADEFTYSPKASDMSIGIVNATAFSAN